MSSHQVSPGRHIRPFARFAFMSLLMFLFAGCVSYPRYYLYDGAPRAQTEVSTVVLQGDLTLASINGIPMATYSKIYDIHPGDYAFDVTYFTSGEVSRYKKVVIRGRVDAFKLNAQPGHIYYLYPSRPDKRTWKLEMTDFANVDDLSKFKPGFWSDAQSGEWLRGKVDQHFQKRDTHGVRISENKQWE